MNLVYSQKNGKRYKILVLIVYLVRFHRFATIRMEFRCFRRDAEKADTFARRYRVTCKNH